VARESPSTAQPRHEEFQPERTPGHLQKRRCRVPRCGLPGCRECTLPVSKMSPGLGTPGEGLGNKLRGGSSPLFGSRAPSPVIKMTGTGSTPAASTISSLRREVGEGVGESRFTECIPVIFWLRFRSTEQPSWRAKRWSRCWARTFSGGAGPRHSRGRGRAGQRWGIAPGKLVGDG